MSTERDHALVRAGMDYCIGDVKNYGSKSMQWMADRWSKDTHGAIIERIIAHVGGGSLPLGSVTLTIHDDPPPGTLPNSVAQSMVGDIEYFRDEAFLWRQRYLRAVIIAAVIACFLVVSIIGWIAQ